MKILLTSIVDLKKSQHNRPHELVKYLSRKHEITALSINDWWKGGPEEIKSFVGIVTANHISLPKAVSF
ncbi:MAG: hypothetical protein FIB07_17215 [Candidatus Methanoperedens sp.]|nr:hypothetical protein [Candidatus Methanoperedens sp.]